jgi:hypothetical protein
MKLAETVPRRWWEVTVKNISDFVFTRKDLF